MGPAYEILPPTCGTYFHYVAGTNHVGGTLTYLSRALIRNEYNEWECALRENASVTVSETPVTTAIGTLFTCHYSPSPSSSEFLPEPASESILVIHVHGLNDHGGRFARHVPHFLSAGFSVVTFDHYGHGRSVGVHGYIPSFEYLITGLRDVIHHYTTRLPSARIMLLGESMGGLCVIRTLSDLRQVVPVSRIIGYVLINPLVRAHPASTPPRFLNPLLRLIARLFPTLALIKANKGQNHPDPSVEEEFGRDPGTYSGSLRLGTGVALLDAMGDLVWPGSREDDAGDKGAGGNAFHPASKDQEWKGLVIVGTQDRVTDHEATVSYFSGRSPTLSHYGTCADEQSSGVSIVRVDGGAHVLTHTEQEAQHIFGSMILSWIQSTISENVKRHTSTTALLQKEE